MSNDDNAKAVSDAAATTSGTSALAGNQHDYGTDRAKNTTQDVDKDTGTDERYEVESADRSSAWFQNGKRTYDLHQSMDTQAMLSNQQNLNYQTVQRDRHTELAYQDERARKNELHQQTMRHYEDQHTIRYASASGFWSDTVRDVAKDVKDIKAQVCTK